MGVSKTRDDTRYTGLVVSFYQYAIILNAFSNSYITLLNKLNIFVGLISVSGVYGIEFICQGW